MNHSKIPLTRWIGSFCAVLLLTVLTGTRSTGTTLQPVEYSNPTEIRSENGVLRAKFVLQATDLTFNGRKVHSYTYNGLYVPPTLRLKPGDTLELEFENRCPQPSNIHFHGMAVTPLYNGDNIFVRVDPGHTFHYKFLVPKDHETGLYYYHAHSHGIAQRQITFGFTGALIVEGQLDAYPALSKIKEQVMVLKDILISPFGTVPQDIVTSRTTIRTVNGLMNPVIRMQPGETQFWRIASTGANLYYRLTLGGQTFWVIAEDANATVRMLPVKEYLLGPSARVEVLVQFPEAGKFALRTEKVRTGPVGDGYPAQDLVTVLCEGEAQKAVRLPLKRDCCAKPLDDYRELKIDKKRLIVFNETDTDFRINNQIFNESRIDTKVPLGTVEEWTLRNSTDELHQFHIHQVDFQVVEINGKPVEFTGHRDNFVIPIRGEVKMIIPFTNPVIVGNFVYHCHIIEHEDGGMMATIQVYDPKNPNGVPAPSEHITAPPENPRAEGGPIHLIDKCGELWRSEDSDADLLLVSFGYTRCQGACPITQSLLHETLNLLKDFATRIQPVLVSIDPDRDTPQSLLEYVDQSGTDLIPLTGSQVELARVARSFGVAVKRQPKAEDGSYAISHSTEIFLTTRDGRVLKRFELITSPEEIARQVRQELRRTAPLATFDELTSARLP